MPRFSRVKFHFKLLQYWSLPPCTNVIKCSIKVIYCLSIVITKVILLYKKDWQQYLAKVVNYYGKKFYNIGQSSDGKKFNPFHVLQIDWKKMKCAHTSRPSKICIPHLKVIKIAHYETSYIFAHYCNRN